jgi:hypothetical protein
MKKIYAFRGRKGENQPSIGNFTLSKKKYTFGGQKDKKFKNWPKLRYVLYGRPLSIGSPQGSVLSPILFACFINDVDDHIRNCRFHLYADDLQIYSVDGYRDA